MRIDYAAETVMIHKDLETVFNFISRGAQYERWHFDYHLRAEILDVREGGVGSVFSIEELIAGYYLRHVGRIVVFERNRRFVWKGRFALFPWVFIGTDFTFSRAGNDTRVREVLYFEMNPLLAPSALVFLRHKEFRPAACRAHCKDEVMGVKAIWSPAITAKKTSPVPWKTRI